MIEDNKSSRWNRAKSAAIMKDYQQITGLMSQRLFAKEASVPRTTLQYWLERKGSIDHKKIVVDFFESPDGLAVLHQIIIAANFVITLVGPSGIRSVCQFLELSGLNRFVASSYGSVQKLTAEMENEVLNYEHDQRTSLSHNMKPKQITVAQDETFHPEICLVAIEPVSNFILLEHYSEKRDAKSWSKAMVDAIKDLPVTVRQSTSDEGTGLLLHAKEGLGAHHSPDLCHVQSSLIKGTALALASNKRAAQQAYQETEAQTNQLVDQQKASQGQVKRGRPINYHQRIAAAQQSQSAAQQTLAKAEHQQKQAKSAIETISLAYHPYDLETGYERSPQYISYLLETQFGIINWIALEAGLTDRCKKLIEKAQRVMAQLVATIAFFHLTVAATVEALSLSADVEKIMRDNLIPAYYLKLAARKAATAQQREAILVTSEKLLAPVKSEASPLSNLSEQDRKLVEDAAQECAEIFQRSSSCVEGRNGQLSLRHHSLHKIGTRKLQALTVVHNYFIKRRDGTTAAQRFFGAKPADLFEWLLDRVSLPARPAKKLSLLKAA